MVDAGEKMDMPIPHKAKASIGSKRMKRSTPSKVDLASKARE